MKEERTVTQRYYQRVMKKQLGGTRGEGIQKDSPRPFFLKRIDKSRK